MSREAARKWFKQACHDIEMAEKNITIGGYDVAAFLSHQAVEKLLKAGFLMEGRRMPKTHFIDELAEKLGIPRRLQDRILELTPDYTLARYPDVSDTVPYRHYRKETAEGKIRIAKDVLHYFKERWGQP